MISRTLRPLMRASTLSSSVRTAQFSSRAAAFARPSVVSTGLKMRKAPTGLEAKKAQIGQVVSQQKVLMAGMPQLVPFYFVNEVVAGYAAIGIVCYLLTKYWLPQTVRSRLARLFVSKL